MHEQYHMVRATVTVLMQIAIGIAHLFVSAR
jgi:hypothetical protein